MKELIVKQSQAFLLLEALNHFCGTIKINVKMEGVVIRAGMEPQYHVKMNIDNYTLKKINGYINDNSTNE